MVLLFMFFVFISCLLPRSDLSLNHCRLPRAVPPPPLAGTAPFTRHGGRLALDKSVRQKKPDTGMTES